MLATRQLFNLLAYLALIIFMVYRMRYSSKNLPVYTDDVFHENKPLEEIIQQIPECTSDDHFRHRILLFMLRAWNDFAHKSHIQYWIGYGTLVGYVQRGGLLPHDGDIDILILAQDTKQLIPFSDVNFSSTYEIKLHPQWNIDGWENRIYYPSKGIDFIAPNARFIDRKYRHHIDIWPSYDYIPNKTKHKQAKMKTRTEYDKEYKWMSSPDEWTFPLKSCVFSGINVSCPAMPEKLITMFYGMDAFNKSDIKCVNGVWM